MLKKTAAYYVARTLRRWTAIPECTLKRLARGGDGIKPLTQMHAKAALRRARKG